MKLVGILLILCFGSRTSGDGSGLRKEPSNKLLTFLYLINGKVTNAKEAKLEQAEWNQTEHDVVVGSFRSVFVPALPNDIVLLMEQSVNGVLYRLEILKVREYDDLGGIISLEPHNFTDITKYKAGQFDVTKDFDNVRLEDLSPERPECDSFYMQADANVFVGTMPNCNEIVDGKPARYAVTFSCKTMAVLSYSEEAKERDSPLPYLNRNILRYPLLPYVTSGADNFLLPCN